MAEDPDDAALPFPVDVPAQRRHSSSSPPPSPQQPEDWRPVSSVFHKTLLMPNKLYYVADAEEVFGAFSRQRSIRARSVCGPLRSVHGEDQRHQALREEVALRRQVLHEVEKTLKEQKGGHATIPLSRITHQYDCYMEKLKQKQQQQQQNSELVGLSTILKANSSSASSKAVGGVSASSLDVDRSVDAVNATTTTTTSSSLKKRRSTRVVSETLHAKPLVPQTGLPPTYADLHTRKNTPEQQAASVARMHDKQVVISKQLRERLAASVFAASVTSAPHKTKEEIAAAVNNLHHRGVQWLLESRRRADEKHLTVTTINDDPYKKKNNNKRSKAKEEEEEAEPREQLWERLAVSDADALRDEMQHLVTKYAAGATVAGQHVKAIPENQLHEMFERLASPAFT
jgi:hypothetical protein